MKVSLVVPTLNEIVGMREVMPRVNKEWADQILIVDGGSTDGTIEYALENGYEVHKQVQVGIRLGLLEAYEKIIGDIVITFSPDGNSIPEIIPDLIGKLKEGYDMVIVSRYLGYAQSYDDTFVSRLGNWSFTKIINEYNVKAEEMEKVVVKGSMMYAPIFFVRHPQGPVSMQFSAAHSLANAAFRVTPGPKWQYPESVNDPKMEEFRNKVAIELDSRTLEVMAQDLAGELPKQPIRVPTTVEVMARGKVYRESVEYAKGDPPAWVEGMAMSDEELKDKFRNQAVDVLSMSASWRENIERAIEVTYNLEKVGDITELVGLLSP